MKNFLLFLFIILISLSAKTQNLLLNYTFYPWDVQGDTIIDISGNGNDALMIGGAYIVGGAVKVGEDSTDYLDVPPVINGLNDFSIVIKITVQNFHHNGIDPMNTIFSASDAGCNYCFGLAYNKLNDAWELTLNGVLHSFPEIVSNLKKQVIEVVRHAGLVSLYRNGFFGGSFYDATPLNASTFIFGQHEHCLNDCFSENQALGGGLSRLRILDGAVYLKQSNEEMHAVLLYVFPNPVSSSATISFSSPQDSHTTIALYDIAGRKLKTLLDENVEAGDHEVQLNRDQLNAGIYFLQLKMNGEVVTKKLAME
jgi:hypothetical protein